MNSIGGYFELELNKGEHFHKNAICLNTARNCLEYILLAREYKKVYIPYYTCNVILQPFIKHNIKFEFYHIDEQLEPIELLEIKRNEAFLYTNYYGLKQQCVKKLSKIYGNQLIVDNAQAFYAKRISHIDTFYSARKFFGVPDGAYLYTDKILEEDLPLDKSFSRMEHLFIRIDKGAEAGYNFFKKNDELLDNQPICKMSNLTERILKSIDYEKIRKIRQANYYLLHEKLKDSNKFSIEICDEFVPMAYLYLPKDIKRDLKKYLIENKVFVATYWPNVIEWCDNSRLEYKLAKYVIPIPIDQRYGIDDMKKIINYIYSYE